MMKLVLLAALAVVLVGAWAVGYSPKALVLAGWNKLKEIAANFKA